MSSAEVASLRSEIESIRFKLDLIKEAVALRKEVEIIRAGVENVKKQAQATPAASSSASASTSTSTPAAKPATSSATAPQSTPAPAPTSVTVPAAVSVAPVKSVTVTQTVTPITTASGAPATKVTTTTTTTTTATTRKIGEVGGAEIKHTAVGGGIFSKEEADGIAAAKSKEAAKPVVQNFGIDADLAKKQEEKYDANAEQEARDWIEKVTGEKLTGTFGAALKSGVTLCNLINKIKPGSVKKINKMSAPFMQMENINNYLDASKALGVPVTDSFMTVDLYEEKNINQVILALHSLGRLSRNIPNYNGPSIGAKIATAHERNFTEDQLKQGKFTSTLAQQSQKGAQGLVADLRTGTTSHVRSKDAGTTTASVGLLDANKAEVQKEASSVKREGHNIIRK